MVFWIIHTCLFITSYVSGMLIGLVLQGPNIASNMAAVWPINLFLPKLLFSVNTISFFLQTFGFISATIPPHAILLTISYLLICVHSPTVTCCLQNTTQLSKNQDYQKIPSTKPARENDFCAFHRGGKKPSI